jgi:hypothetical protein
MKLAYENVVPVSYWTISTGFPPLRDEKLSTALILKSGAPMSKTMARQASCCFFDL